MVHDQGSKRQRPAFLPCAVPPSSLEPMGLKVAVVASKEPAELVAFVSLREGIAEHMRDLEQGFLRVCQAWMEL